MLFCSVFVVQYMYVSICLVCLLLVREKAYTFYIIPLCTQNVSVVFFPIPHVKCDGWFYFLWQNLKSPEIWASECACERFGPLSTPVGDFLDFANCCRKTHLNSGQNHFRAGPPGFSKSEHWWALVVHLSASSLWMQYDQVISRSHCWNFPTVMDYTLRKTEIKHFSVKWLC